MTTTQRRIKRADPTTIQDKFLVGYQGWFTCSGDGDPVGPGHHGWLHWFNHPIPDGGRPNTDVWPDVSAYSPEELYPAPGVKTKSGEQVHLFSSRNPQTVQRHFHWMAEHGVDGAFLQRFAGQTDLETGNEGIRKIRDEVGDRVREAAETEGRVFAIMYDVSGVPADRIGRVIERDWIHLVREKGVLNSPNYLREKGRPVIALWGFGFEGSNHTPSLVKSIISYIRDTTPNGAYIMAGVPSHWRTSEGDADRNPGFLDVWLNDVDAISPWTIGRYSNDIEADGFCEGKMKGDVELLKRSAEENANRGVNSYGVRKGKVDYIPVIFPGGSGFNLSEGKWAWNGIKRNGGRFLWKQLYNAKKLGVRTIYGAMWDEYDEGTAFMPIVTHKRLLPDCQNSRYKFMALDEDGYDLPSDWYMRICGFASEIMHNEKRLFESFPSKELQDYWSCRPKYEELNTNIASGSGSGSGAPSNAYAGGSGSGQGVGETGVKTESEEGQSYDAWLAAQGGGNEKDELPPPPYSLEDDEPAPTPTPAPAPASVSNTSPTPNPNPNLNTNVGTGAPSTITTPSSSAGVSQSNYNQSAYAGQYQSPLQQQHSQQQPLPQQTPYQQSPYQQTYPAQHTNTDQAVAGLVHDFGRTNISSPPPGQILGQHTSYPPYLNPQSQPQSPSPQSQFVGQGPPGAKTYSPPPLHPAHPAVGRPYGAGVGGGVGPRPGSAAGPGVGGGRPQSQSQIPIQNPNPNPYYSYSPSPVPNPSTYNPTPQPYSTYNQTPSPTPPTHLQSHSPYNNSAPSSQSHSPLMYNNTTTTPYDPNQYQNSNTNSGVGGEWSQTQWPPQEWKVGGNPNMNTSTPSSSQYPGSGSGYNPTSISSGVGTGTGSGTNLRPHAATIGHGHHSSIGVDSNKLSNTIPMGPASSYYEDGPSPTQSTSQPSGTTGGGVNLRPHASTIGHGYSGMGGTNTNANANLPLGPSSSYYDDGPSSNSPPHQFSSNSGPNTSFPSSPYPTSPGSGPGQSHGYNGHGHGSGQSGVPLMPNFPSSPNAPYPQHQPQPPYPDSGPGLYHRPSIQGGQSPQGYRPQYSSPPPLNHNQNNSISSSNTGPGPGGMFFPQASISANEPGFNAPGMNMPTYGFNPPHSTSTTVGGGGGGYPPSSPQSHSPGFGGSMPMFPQVHGQNSGSGGPWVHNTSGPAIPPRPNNTMKPTSSNSGGPGPSFPIASAAGSQALGFALSGVQKVAGKKTKDQLEAGIGSLAQSGSKLFSKFTK